MTLPTDCFFIANYGITGEQYGSSLLVLTFRVGVAEILKKYKDRMKNGKKITCPYCNHTRFVREEESE